MDTLKYNIVNDQFTPTGRQITVSITTTGDANSDLLLKITPTSPLQQTYSVNPSLSATDAINFVRSQIVNLINSTIAQIKNNAVTGLSDTISIDPNSISNAAVPVNVVPRNF